MYILRSVHSDDLKSLLDLSMIMTFINHEKKSIARLKALNIQAKISLKTITSLFYKI